MEWNTEASGRVASAVARVETFTFSSGGRVKELHDICKHNLAEIAS